MKTIIVGMINPLCADPANALYPAPERSTDHRLWRMLHEVCGATRVDYRDGFDRRNLVVGEWSADRLFAELRELPSPRPGGKLLTVVALGDEVANALLLRGQDIVLPRVRDGIAWRRVPHPSGRNRWYDEPEHRLMVGLLLEELLHADMRGPWG